MYSHHNRPRIALSRPWAKYRMLCRFRPAIDIRPFNGRYMCARSVNAAAWPSLIPVKLGREINKRPSGVPTLQRRGEGTKALWGSPEHPNLVHNVFPAAGGL